MRPAVVEAGALYSGACGLNEWFLERVLGTPLTGMGAANGVGAEIWIGSGVTSGGNAGRNRNNLRWSHQEGGVAYGRGDTGAATAATVALARFSALQLRQRYQTGRR